AQQQQFQQLVNLFQPLVNGQIQTLDIGLFDGLDVSLNSDSLALLDRMSAVYLLGNFGKSAPTNSPKVPKSTTSKGRVAQEQLTSEASFGDWAAETIKASVPEYLDVLKRIGSAVGIATGGVALAGALGLVALPEATVVAVLGMCAWGAVTWGGAFL